MIQHQEHGDVTLLRLEHGKANVFDLEFTAALESMLTERQDAALVITGSGRIFSAGVDLFRLPSGDDPALDTFLAGLSNVLRMVFCHPRPVVAAINGHAVAGGCVLAAACDQRIAAAGDYKIGITELPVGVPFPPAPLQIMRAVLPPHQVARMVFRGHTVPPDEAQVLGLVDEVVPLPELIDRALALATDLAAIPARSYALTKAQLRQPFLDIIDNHDQRFAADIRDTWGDPEIRAAITRFLDRNVKK